MWNNPMRRSMPYVEYDEVQAVCSDCGRIFPSEDALSAHRAESHAVEDVTAAAPRPARRRSASRPARSS
jgi:hypothetical protein